MIKNTAASVRERLYQLSVREGEEFGLVLTRFVLERLLYRLSQSAYRDRLVLKGALLFQVWTGTPHRPTRDLDLLGFGEPSLDRCQEVIRHLCSISDASDGLAFDADSIRAEAIKEDDVYHGVRVRLTARLAQARIPVQVDIGFGDLVSPPPKDIDYPTLLGMAKPRVRAYSMESVIAEKLEAMVSLGLLNSRLKDFFDVWFLARTFPFEAAPLRTAILGTFSKRKTAWSRESLAAVLSELEGDAAKEVQWRAFLRRSRLTAAESFRETARAIRDFAAFPDQAAEWRPGGPWILGA